MRATITYTDKGLILDIGGVKFSALDKASFDTEVAVEDLPKLVELDPSALGILKVMSQGEVGGRSSPTRRRPGRPPKNASAPRASSRRGAKRSGISIWSGASAFNPRWSNLKPEEVSSLGVDRLPSPLWGKVRDAIKGLDKDTWKELRPKWESRLKESAKGDDKSLEGDWRGFLEAAQKKSK